MENKYYIDKIKIENDDGHSEVIYDINNSHSFTNADIVFGLHLSKKLGVLSEYVDKMYTREKMNEVISYLISHNPYIGGSNIKLSIYISRFIEKENDRIVSAPYHRLDFRRIPTDVETNTTYYSVRYQFYDVTELSSALQNLYNEVRA